MANRLIRLGDKGFNLEAIAGWLYQTQPEFPNDKVLYLYLSGINEPMHFEGEEAQIIEKLLNTSSQHATSIVLGIR